MTEKFAKGATVTYRAQGGTGSMVEARVLRKHRDATATIEATFALNNDGAIVPGYLGMRFRLPLSRLTENVPA